MGAGQPAGHRFALARRSRPLPYEDGAFDGVFAISVWSHFDRFAGREVARGDAPHHSAPAARCC